MKFIVSSTALSSHLQAISRVINSKNALPILDCFLFELEDGTLSVTVSDSETTMVTTVEVNESDTNGRFAVVAKTLLDALKEIPEQPLTFLINPDNYEITVQYQNGKYSLMGQNADEFPQSAVLGDNAVRVEMEAKCCWGNQPLGLRYCRRRTPSGDERYLFRYYNRRHHDGGFGRPQAGTLKRRWLPRETNVLPSSFPKNRLHCSKTFCRRNKAL